MGYIIEHKNNVKRWCKKPKTKYTKFYVGVKNTLKLIWYTSPKVVFG
jgi:hypothetical protein